MQTNTALNPLKHWFTLTPRHGLKKKRSEARSHERRRFFLGGKHPNVYFTRREAQCVYYLLSKKRRKEIANRLNLSIRTVEFYIVKAKKKLKSHSQKELVHTVSQTEFLSTYEPNHILS